MFEHDQEIVNSLLVANDHFKNLFQEHNDLKARVRDAETGVLSVDDINLASMKKQKLLTKDKMAAIIADFRRAQA